MTEIKKLSLSKKALLALCCILVGFVCYKGYKIFKKNQHVKQPNLYIEYLNDIKEIVQWEEENGIGFKVTPAVFEKEGIDNIALVTMIKDEEDVIYENLVWHFCVGFRKFVVVDNNSTDKTRELIEKFKRKTDGKAIVVIIDDPIVEHIQSAILTGSMYFVKSIWPKTEWVFPVDGDEFWYPNTKLSDILKNVPSDKDAIIIMQYNHFFVEKAHQFDSSKPFYESMPYRTNSLIKDGLTTQFGRVAVRPKLDITIAQGYHLIKSHNEVLIKYAKGNKLGLSMRHFPRRSIAQVKKKYLNGARANIAGQQKGVISPGDGTHWTAFQDEIQEKGVEQATIDRFNEFIVDKEIMLHDPLPMQEAFTLFEELTK